MTDKPINSTVFIAGGVLTGAGAASTVGNMGLVGSLGGVSVGAAPVMVAGAIARLYGEQ